MKILCPQYNGLQLTILAARATDGRTLGVKLAEFEPFYVELQPVSLRVFTGGFDFIYAIDDLLAAVDKAFAVSKRFSVPRARLPPDFYYVPSTRRHPSLPTNWKP
jgi:hypothetical protein